MAKYLKLFNNDASYEAWKASENYILPSVCYTEDGNLFYNPFINEPTFTYTMVDLGLPSGVKWADRNIGATSPEDSGLYFQWSDTIGYTVEQVGVDKTFYWDNCVDVSSPWGPSFIKYSMSKKTILDIEDDAARIYMGDLWRIPSRAEYQELIANTTQIYVDIDGNESETMPSVIQGVKLVSNINGKSIYFPASGIIEKSSIGYINDEGAYWTNELAKDKSAYIAIMSSRMQVKFAEGSYLFRCNGHSIRAVHE